MSDQHIPTADEAELAEAAADELPETVPDAYEQARDAAAGDT